MNTYFGVVKGWSGGFRRYAIKLRFVPPPQRLLYAHNCISARSHAPRGNAEWTLCVPRVPRSTRSVSAAFPRGAWERENESSPYQPKLLSYAV